MRCHIQSNVGFLLVRERIHQNLDKETSPPSEVSACCFPIFQWLKPYHATGYQVFACLPEIYEIRKTFTQRKLDISKKAG